jgi:hypothetical protein
MQERLKGVRRVWASQRPVNESELPRLRAQTWAAFDHAYSSYMHNAFPKVCVEGLPFSLCCVWCV